MKEDINAADGKILPKHRLSGRTAKEFGEVSMAKGSSARPSFENL